MAGEAQRVVAWQLRRDPTAPAVVRLPADGRHQPREDHAAGRPAAQRQGDHRPRPAAPDRRGERLRPDAEQPGDAVRSPAAHRQDGGPRHRRPALRQVRRRADP